MLGSRRPRLARFLVALVFAAFSVAPSMAQPRDDGAMLDQLYDGGDTAQLSRHRPAVSLAFTLPDPATVARVRLYLSARPAGKTPASGLDIGLNNSSPFSLRPDPYAFTAQFDLAAIDAQGGENRITVSLADCAAAGDDEGWIIELDQSRLDVVYLAAPPDDLQRFESWFSSDFPGPRRIAFAEDALTEADAAALETLTAIALGRRTTRTLTFVDADDNPDLLVRFRFDSRLERARILPASGKTAALDLLAPDMASAREALKAFGKFSPKSGSILSDGGHGDFIYADFHAGAARSGALVVERDASGSMQTRVSLNGRELGQLRFGGTAKRRQIQLNKLEPGRNRLVLGGGDACGPPGGNITAARFAGHGKQDDDLAQLAAGSLGRLGYSLVLPAGLSDRRTALALIARLASENGGYAAPEWVGFSAMEAPAHTDLAVIAPGGLLPSRLVQQAPRALAASIRSPTPVQSPSGPLIRVAGNAFAASVSRKDGVAARFPSPFDEQVWTTIVTSPVAGDFHVSLAPLIHAETLGRLDGRVARWSSGRIWIQDKGAWRPPGLAGMNPGPTELWLSLCFVLVLASLAVARLTRRPRLKR